MRAIIGKALWVSSDRADLSFATTFLAGQGHVLTQETWKQAQHLTRYLSVRPVGGVKIEPRNGVEIATSPSIVLTHETPIMGFL